MNRADRRRLAWPRTRRSQAAFARGRPRPPARARLQGRRALAASTTCARSSTLAPEDTWIHAFTDGRDVSPHAALADLADAARASASRRSPAATTRWTATTGSSGPRQALDALMLGRGGRGARAPLAAVQASYDAGITDEFIEPTVIDGTPRIAPGDTADLLQLPPRPRPPARAGARRRRRRPDDDDPLRGRPRLPRPLRASRPSPATLAEVLADAGRPPAPRRRDARSTRT